jgi:hypothetical protein
MMYSWAQKLPVNYLSILLRKTDNPTRFNSRLQPWVDLYLQGQKKGFIPFDPEGNWFWVDGGFRILKDEKKYLSTINWVDVSKMRGITFSQKKLASYCEYIVWKDFLKHHYVSDEFIEGSNIPYTLWRNSTRWDCEEAPTPGSPHHDVMDALCKYQNLSTKFILEYDVNWKLISEFQPLTDAHLSNPDIIENLDWTAFRKNRKVPWALKCKYVYDYSIGEELHFIYQNKTIREVNRLIETPADWLIAFSVNSYDPKELQNNIDCFDYETRKYITSHFGVDMMTDPSDKIQKLFDPAYTEEVKKLVE